MLDVAARWRAAGRYHLRRFAPDDVARCGTRLPRRLELEERATSTLSPGLLCRRCARSALALLRAEDRGTQIDRLIRTAAR